MSSGKWIFSILEFLRHGSQIHRMFDDVVVIRGVRFSHSCQKGISVLLFLINNENTLVTWYSFSLVKVLSNASYSSCCPVYWAAPVNICLPTSDTTTPNDYPFLCYGGIGQQASQLSAAWIWSEKSWCLSWKFAITLWRSFIVAFWIICIWNLFLSRFFWFFFTSYKSCSDLLDLSNAPSPLSSCSFILDSCSANSLASFSFSLCNSAAAAWER